RLQAGEHPGYPRFRKRGRFDSLTFPQVPVGCAPDATAKRLMVSKVGRIKMVLHLPLEDTTKTATIRRTGTGKWFVSLSCERKPTPLPPTGQAVGIDVGLRVFAMPTEGDPTENPRFLRAEAHALAKAQRRHQVALDAHKVLRAALTQQVKQAHLDLDARQVWHRVSQDAGERAAWQVRQQRRQVVARTHERIRRRRDDFTKQQRRKLVNQYDF